MTEAASVTKLLYTPAEAADALGISRSSFYVLLSRGAVRSVRIGGCRRIPVQAVTDFIEMLAQESAVAVRHYDGGRTPRSRD